MVWHPATSPVLHINCERASGTKGHWTSAAFSYVLIVFYVVVIVCQWCAIPTEEAME